MTDKHTSGPWETNYTGNIWGDINNPKHLGDNPLIAQIFLGSFGLKKEKLTEEDKANANLIAAAPELLEALELTKYYFTVMEDIVNNSCKEDREEMMETRTVENRTLDEIYEEFAVKSELAIAKARGIK